MGGRRKRRRGRLVANLCLRRFWLSSVDFFNLYLLFLLIYPTFLLSSLFDKVFHLVVQSFSASFHMLCIVLDHS